MAEPKTLRSFYYFHPLFVPELRRWPEEFARIASLGFDAVILAPPFATGGDNSLFLAADHRLLHPRLGGGDALAALARICGMARESGLEILLDLTTDRVDSGAALLAEHPEWRQDDPAAELPPDPRRPFDAGALLPRPAPDPLRAWWLARLGEWAGAGIRGFRCLDVSAGHGFWGPLIRELRGRRPDLVFIAWTQGVAPADLDDLAPCGFDLTASSLPWWDYEAGWWGEEAARLSCVAPILTTPKAPHELRPDPAPSLPRHWRSLGSGQVGIP